MKHNYLEYDGFIGTVHFDADEEVFYGKIEEIDDLVTFEGSTVKQIKSAFIEAVKDYQEICSRNEKPVFKSFKGSFNIRIGSDLHKLAFRESLKQGISLNQYVQKALESQVREAVLK